MRSRPILRSVALVAMTTAGCLERPIERQDAHTTVTVVEKLPLSGVERIDLLLAIDNSSSMGDKQEILARAVPDLVKRLANPRCVDGSGAAVKPQPESPTLLCPAGSEREFTAVLDIHIGIVSSSLGGGQSGYCTKAGENDKGQLVSRTLAGAALPTYENHGFLAWDPEQKLSPPGQALLDGATSALVPTLQQMVRGVGEQGCGFEGQLESWYRFLIDPDPYLKLEQSGNDLVPVGHDTTILDQRKAFLRPDSLLAILMLSDENDCSLAPGDGVAKIFSSNRMVRPRSECAENANDACCAPCDEAPAECAPDASCKDENSQWARLSDDDDDPNLRCFNQKSRFGKSYLHPLDRYVAGLTQPQVPDRKGYLVPNPLYIDLNPDDDLRETRTTGLVFLAGIVGVPWQDIAKDPTSLAAGLKSAKQLAERDGEGRSAWDVILGDPEKGIAPLDPHMREDTRPRTGENPVTGTSMQPPEAGPNADPIVGHERPELINNLQYACIFPLLTPITCTEVGCDCTKPDKNPLCQTDSGAYTNEQLYGKAYPGTRELQVLEAIKEQAIVASVCPANMIEASASEEEAPDFGYRPAIGALIDRLKDKLGHQCLPRELTPDAQGQVGCMVLEARKEDSCSCNASDGRIPVQAAHEAAVDVARDSGILDGSKDCFCEVPQLGGDELQACQNQKADPLVVDGDQVDGWCYVDASSVPPVGSPELVPESCVSTERRLVRLVGNAKVHPGSTLFILCSE